MRKTGLLCLAGLMAIASCKSSDETGKDKEPSIRPAEPTPGKDRAKALEKRASELAQRFIITDGHVDLPYRLMKTRKENGDISEDISEKTNRGDFDFVRARAGGLDAPFMSIYVPASYQKQGGAKKFADGLIDLVETFPKKWPEKFGLARSPEDVRKNHAKGIVSLPMGMENGAPIEDDLKNVAHFHKRGIRYITLTHSKDNQICDSSYDTTRTWKGLSPFGKKVVEEMNRVGIMIDISHVTDDTFYQVLELTKVPVIASHSSARHFTTDFERNMADEMIAALAKNGGVIMINFGSTFVGDKARRYSDKRRAATMAYRYERKLAPGSPEVKKFADEWRAQNPPVFATVSDVADHIDHAVKIAGIDHVGLGSDFDGVGDTLPIGLKDASMYPNLFRVLLERGYSEEDIEKIASKNLFRVWEAVAKHAESAGQ